jgi:hypothetical protein
MKWSRLMSVTWISGWFPSKKIDLGPISQNFFFLGGGGNLGIHNKLVRLILTRSLRIISEVVVYKETKVAKHTSLLCLVVNV